MPWKRIIIESRPEDAEAIGAALEAHGAVAVTFEDAADEPLFERAPETAPLWTHTRVAGLFDATVDVDAIAAQFDHGRTAHAMRPPRVDTVEDQDWGRAWMDRFQPIDCGHGLWICPSWHRIADPAATVVELDPGMAFGTGSHPTTALCLEWLAGQDMTGRRVIDYGCGSGVLAIAALKRGASGAVGVDNDPRALEVSRENAARNGVGDHLQLTAPEGLDPGTTANVVFANILLEPLLALADLLSALVLPGDRLVLSGLLEAQAPAIEQRYGDAFDLQLHRRDGWAMLVGTKR